MNRTNLISLVTSVVALVFIIVGFAAPLWLVYELEPANYIIFKLPKIRFYCNLMTCEETTSGVKINSQFYFS